MNLLEIKHIVKEYRRGMRANDDISLKVEAGEVFGLLGPNGAGKTTLVNQIIGLVGPTSGSIALDGVDIVAHPDYARQGCSFQPQSQAPIDGLTLRQAVELIGRMRGGREQQVRRRATELFAVLDIASWADKPGQTLSGGVSRLAAFCMAVVVPGRLVILDEPTNDVDPLRRRLLWQLVRDLADRGSAVLLVTHNVLEAERSVDRLAIINQGRVAAAGSPASLKQRELDSLRLELILEPTVAPPDLPQFLSRRMATGRRLIAQLEPTCVGEAVSWAQRQRDSGLVEEFSLGPATLEDVYVRIVGRPDLSVATDMEVHHDLSTALVS
jgi:ABC-2 type transport system ATP-binding protein